MTKPVQMFLIVALVFIAIGLFSASYYLFILSPQKVQEGVRLRQLTAPPPSTWKQKLISQIGPTANMHVLDTDPNFLIIVGVVRLVSDSITIQAGDATLVVDVTPETTYQSISGTNISSARKSGLEDISSGSNIIMRLLPGINGYVAEYIQIQR